MRSTEIAPTRNPFCPATPTFDGGLIGAHVDPFAIERGFQRRDAGVFVKLHPRRKTVPVKYRSLNQPQRRHRDRRAARPVAYARCRSTRFSTPSSGLVRFFAVARQHRKRELRVEHVGLQFLERQHGDVLLLQLVQTFLAALAGGLEYVDHAAPHRAAFGHARQKIAMAMAAGCAIT